MLLQPGKARQGGEEGEEGETRRSDEWESEGERELRYLVDVPFLTSQMLHLKASAVFLKVQTLQSQ